MPEVSGTETGCLKAGLRPKWNTSLLAAGVLETALWYWITYFFNRLGSSLPRLTSFVGQWAGPCSAAGASHVPPCVRAGGQEVCGVSGALRMFDAMSVVQLGHGLRTTGGTSQYLAWGSHMPVKHRAKPAVTPQFHWCANWKWCPLDVRCPPWLASWRRHPPMPLCCSCPCPPLGTAEPCAQLAQEFQCQWQAAAVRVSHPSLGRVSARLGWECICNMFCFPCQRQSVRNMVWVSIFLGAFPEKCNIWLLAQGSCAAPVSQAAAGPRKMLLFDASHQNFDAAERRSED